MNRVMVTGGAGYIGSHACKALRAAGWEPVVYDNLVYGHREAVKWGPFEQGDILDEARLAEVFAAYRPVAVMHFAAFAYVGESVTDPEKYYRNNVEGTAALLRAMRKAEIGRLIFSSSCATYGMAETIPILEAQLQAPINPYGRTKLIGEQIARDYTHAYGFDCIALRYFNAAGADLDGEIGEDHDPETHLIPLVLQAAAGIRPTITVFGDDYDTPDGTCIRDYLHVADLASAHVAALERLDAGSKGFAALNLGTGQGTSVREIIEAAQRVTGRSIPVTMAPRREGDPAALVADPSAANDMLGWTARHSDLDTIISTAWNWLDLSTQGALRRA
ncbi:UDP-glucose 4-epimerase GalE [Sphingomonas alpina]|uniref:UDP-glucose 4-epimerase n=1 Tax=Sphingomonas alpina TaxID=653931 RepID=A0A7H0LDC6_9SPHN|nr:UDP-glucose 4-epimerase GalE [Sphingomonas alpina]QNQ07679.1 UDP-glucose 4-epimerase GalE [Sphingomonas alpina]